jgi:N-acetylmuramoyl-L-alanine amidase
MATHVGWIAGLTGGIAAAAIAWGALHPLARRGARLPAEETVDPSRWPGDAAVLTRVTASFPPGFGLARVVLDPGHGAPANRGNRSSFCVDEQDAMLELAEALRERLEATGYLQVRLSRDAGALVDYDTRVAEAEAWGARAFVSLHSDIRGHAARWSPEPGRSCLMALDAPGFAVLYADEGPPALVAARLALGRAAAARLIEAGFLPYGGAAYVGLYGADEEPGVFVDRHAPEQRIFVLRRTTMPAILVETHNALDPREAARWRTPETVDALGSAVAAALADALGGDEARHGG